MVENPITIPADKHGNDAPIGDSDSDSLQPLEKLLNSTRTVTPQVPVGHATVLTEEMPRPISDSLSDKVQPRVKSQPFGTSSKKHVEIQETYLQSQGNSTAGRTSLEVNQSRKETGSGHSRMMHRSHHQPQDGYYDDTDDTDNSSEDDGWEVRRIIASSGGKFKVDWAPTWEPKANLHPSLVERFEKSQRAKIRKTNNTQGKRCRVDEAQVERAKKRRF